jgi:hypothetical protein
MADKKISALTGASTPLAGTEVLPIVQSSSTVKVAVSNLTAGRTVAASGYTATGDSGFGTTSPLYRNHTVLESATTNAPISPVGVTALTTGTAANGFGIQFENLAEASDGNTYAQTLVTSAWTNATAANRSSKYSIWTRNNGGALTEQFTVGPTGDLTTTGNVLVGTTSVIQGGTICSSFAGDTKNGIVLQTTFASAGTAFIRFVNSAGTSQGEINANATTTVAYNTTSDYRLKNTIAPMTGALAKVALLKPCTYKWNVNGLDGQGFIAHELAEVVPDCVSGEKDAVDAEGNPKYQGIDTSFLVATLTAAIQEQQAIIESLKARLDAANF